ncbi:MAG: biotin/lipoyl-containing protein, partial [Thermodesulfobacteriota bacterium]|nr:biotin/lipoyl-containing protein [Thermodesulfobacteriota bacterium]
VTPTSQIVGVQTVNNVLFDDENEQYRMITDQVKDLCYGLYGEPPVPVNPEVREKVLKGYSRGEKPITCRPAEVLEPELEKAGKDVKGLAVDLDDVLIYALYPVTGKRFLKWKYGKEEPPPEVKPKTLEDVKAEQDLTAKALAGRLVEKAEKEAPPKGENLRTFNVFVDDEYFEVGVEEPGGSPVVSYVRQRPASASVPAVPTAALTPVLSPSPAPPAAPAPPRPAVASVSSPVKESASAARKKSDTDGTPLTAPMPGMIISYQKHIGDPVKKGESVVILEAMKMENALPSPVAGTIKAIDFSTGDSVAKGDVLCVIGDPYSMHSHAGA